MAGVMRRSVGVGEPKLASGGGGGVRRYWTVFRNPVVSLDFSSRKLIFTCSESFCLAKGGIVWESANLRTVLLFGNVVTVCYKPLGEWGGQAKL